MTPDGVEVVLVSYHSRRHVLPLLASWPEDLPVVLVDNSPGRESLGDLVEANPLRRLIPDGTGGFGAAVNRAASTSAAEVLLLVNPDARPPVDVLAELVVTLRADPGLLAVGPLTCGPDGTIEIGIGGWEPSLRRALVHATGLHKLWPRAGMVARPRVGERLRVDWVSGACLAVRRAELLALGGFDERYHLYCEDLDLGVRATHAGLPSVLRTDLVVAHVGAGSGGSRTRSARLKGQALARWLTLHRPAPLAWAARVVLAAGMGARVPIYVLRRRRDQAREGVAYLLGLVSGRA